VDPIALVTLGGMTVIAALFARLWLASDVRRTRRLLRRTRVTPIAELVDGQLACIVGRVEPQDGIEPLIAMMSRRRCVAYETVVQHYEGLKTTHVEVERKMVPFFIVDATGRARIDAAQAALSNPPIARGDRYDERVIEPGMIVRLVGSVALDPALVAGERLFREGGFTATLTGTSRFPLLVDVERA